MGMSPSRLNACAVHAVAEGSALRELHGQGAEGHEEGKEHDKRHVIVRVVLPDGWKTALWQLDTSGSSRLQKGTCNWHCRSMTCGMRVIPHHTSSPQAVIWQRPLHLCPLGPYEPGKRDKKRVYRVGAQVITWGGFVSSLLLVDL